MIITGIQPTGSLHVGNYLGAIKPLLKLQRDDADTYVFIADYHAITAGFDPKLLGQHSRELTAMILASGFNQNRGRIFLQSDVPEHVELAHILGCTAARVGQLNRMTQFREKMEKLGESAETPSLGLYSYPVLQAADILLYQDDSPPTKEYLNGIPTKVPVGDDQSQHLNLVVDIANSFNHRFGQTFIVPQPVISPTPRIMSLTDGTKKMSKSDDNDMSRINLIDNADTIRRKIKRATSDSAYIPDNLAAAVDRPELRNLLTLYAAFADVTVAEALQSFAGKGFGALKPALADAMIAHLEPIQRAYAGHLSAGIVEAALHRGARGASVLASGTLGRVRKAIGLA